jgi:hypothetical protein
VIVAVVAMTAMNNYDAFCASAVPTALATIVIP